MTDTPYFFLYFTTGGRPLKISTNENGQRQNVKVDLVLATLSTRKKDGNGDKNSQEYHQQQQVTSSISSSIDRSSVTAPSSSKQRSKRILKRLLDSSSDEEG